MSFARWKPASKLILVLVSAMLLTSCGPDWLSERLGELTEGSTEASETIGESGFRLALDGVVVSGPSSVAPLGTSVHAELVSNELPESIIEFSENVGTGVEVTLDDGLQPESPVIVTFAPDTVSSWGSFEDAEGDLLPVVFASREDGSGVEFADAHLLPDGSVAVTADHLSFFQPALVSISDFGNWFGDQVDIALELRSNQPDCVDDPNLAPDWRTSVVPNLVLWTCVAEDGDDLDISLTNNSPYVWLVSSTQAYPLEPQIPTTSIVGGTIDLIGLQFVDLETTRPIVPPDGSVTYSTITYNDEYVFSVTLNAPLTVANGTLNVLSAVLPFKKIQALGRAQCLIDAAGTITARPSESLGERTSTLISCAGSVVGGLGGAVLSSLAAGPSAGRAFDGIAELTSEGTDEFTITVFKVSGESIEGWPTDRNDGPSTLWVWLGTRFAFPDWVACDDNNTYCLVGFEGDSHWLVDISELEVIATIEDWVNPREALISLGLPDEIINQILGQ